MQVEGLQRAPFSIREDASNSIDGEPISFTGEDENYALGRLEGVVSEQIIDQVTGRFNRFRTPFPLQSLIEEPFIMDLIRSSRDILDNQGLDKEKDFRESLKGKLFEEIAFRILSSRYGGDRAVISAKDTLQYFNDLIPEASTRSTYHQESLNGFYVPDGLLVEPTTGKITDILEYTVQIGPKSRDVHLKNAGRILGNYARGLQSTRVMVVSPDQEMTPEVEKGLSNMRLKKLPIDLGEFYEFEDHFFDEILEIASPEHFIARFRHQFERYLEREDEGTLDSNMKSFGKKYSKQIDLLRS